MLFVNDFQVSMAFLCFLLHSDDPFQAAWSWFQLSSLVRGPTVLRLSRHCDVFARLLGTKVESNARREDMWK